MAAEIYRLVPSGDLLIAADGHYCVPSLAEAREAARAILAGERVYVEDGSPISEMGEARLLEQADIEMLVSEMTEIELAPGGHGTLAAEMGDGRLVRWGRDGTFSTEHYNGVRFEECSSMPKDIEDTLRAALGPWVPYVDTAE